MKLIKELEKVRRDYKTNSEKFAVDRAIRVVKDWLDSEPVEVSVPVQVNLDRLKFLEQRVEELTEFNQQLHAENKQLCSTVEGLRQANKDLANAAIKPDVNESEELEKAIETVQAALSGSFRNNLKIEVTEQHAWLVYVDLKFIIEPMEAWQAVQSCVYLSGLEVDNE